MESSHQRQLLDTSAIIIGYAMSRLDTRYLSALGLRTWKAAFAGAGSAIGVNGTSLKNLRDEFDPLHSNSRRGWHRRPLRRSRQRVLAELCDVSDAALIELVVRILHKEQGDIAHALLSLSRPRQAVENVAERLLTGRLAEEFFMANSERILGFEEKRIVDRRLDACGFDFGVTEEPSTAVEVKGLKGFRGKVLFTDREWQEACKRQMRYVVVVVGNVANDPVARVFRDPRRSMPALCRYQQIVTAQWVANARVA